MSKVGDVIHDISGWEKEADALIECSETEARAVTEEARNDSSARLAILRQKCAAERNAFLESADAEGRQEAAEIASQTQTDLERMRESLPPRRQGAIERVVKELRKVSGGR